MKKSLFLMLVLFTLPLSIHAKELWLSCVAVAHCPQSIPCKFEGKQLEFSVNIVHPDVEKSATEYSVRKSSDAVQGLGAKPGSYGDRWVVINRSTGSVYTEGIFSSDWNSYSETFLTQEPYSITGSCTQAKAKF